MTQPQPSNRADATTLHDIQGNLVGFNKDHMRLVPLTFSDAETGRAFLSAITPRLATGNEVLRFNDLYKTLSQRRGSAEGVIQATWANLWLSQAGLAAIGASGLDVMPPEFIQGMATRKETLGDLGDSDPISWTPPFAGGAAVHAMLVIAADDEADMDAEYVRLTALIQEHGVAAGEPQAGNARTKANRGREHFGFKDGISQPGIAGLTRSSKETETVAAGEFLVGYLDEDGNVSGQPPTDAAPPLQPGPYNPTPPPPLPQPLPAWTHNGSFVVYRRLRQNVAGFQSFVDIPTPGGRSGDRLAAKLMGRWPGGAPLERVPGEPEDLDPAEVDPASTWLPVLADNKINKFTYENDEEGHATPLAAHIRKMNPRSDNLPDGDASKRHRMLRRGLPYGPEFVPNEPAYGVSVPPEQDRGLLFICYQSSIARSFEFVQSRWANVPEFPSADAGHDPITTQNPEPRSFKLPPEQQLLSIPAWVITTGGDYFFAPSVSGLEQLARVLQ